MAAGAGPPPGSVREPRGRVAVELAGAGDAGLPVAVGAGGVGCGGVLHALSIGLDNPKVKTIQETWPLLAYFFGTSGAGFTGRS